MKIVLQRSGGYGGISETSDLDTAMMNDSSSAELLRLLHNAEGAAKTYQSQAIGADFLTYEVSISENGEQRAWKVVDDGSPALEPVRQLVDYVSGHGGG